jgi:hypothetical protein
MRNTTRHEPCLAFNCHRIANLVVIETSRRAVQIPMCGPCSDAFANNPRYEVRFIGETDEQFAARMVAQAAALQEVIETLRRMGATDEQLRTARLV